jgi:hypothetical protein
MTINIDPKWLLNKITMNRTEAYKDVLGYNLSVTILFLIALLISLPMPNFLLGNLSKEILGVLVLISLLSFFITVPIANKIDNKLKQEIDFLKSIGINEKEVGIKEYMKLKKQFNRPL